MMFGVLMLTVCSVEMCRFAHTCHGNGCSTVSEHLVFCGLFAGCVSIEKYGAHLRRSSFSHQRLRQN